MKTTLLLSGSILLNIVLGWAYFPKPVQILPFAEPTRLKAPNASASEPILEKCITNTVIVTKPVAPFDWRTVESEDYKQYVANLRAIGCPEKTLRDIIVADVTDLFRQRARNGTSNRFEYWKPGLIGNAFDEKRMAQQQEQARDRREVLKTLLGNSYSDNSDPQGGQILSPMEQILGEILSPEKQAAMKALEVKYASRMLKAAQNGGGDDSEEMRKVMADKDAEMLTVMSPEEKAEYELRLSQPAILLRMNMGQFQPSEEEFREMFQTAKKCADQFGLGILARLGNTASQGGGVNEILEGFRSALGEQRFQEFQKLRTVAPGKD